MKHIALLSHGGFDAPGGGIPLLTGLVSRLAERFDCTVYAPHGASGDSGTIACGNARMVPLSVSTAAPAPLKIAALWRAASGDHQRTPFDLVHGFWAIPSGMIAAAFGKRNAIPSVVSLHGAETASLPAIAYGHMRREPYRSLTRWTCRHAGALIVLSAHQRAALRQAGVMRDDAIVIPPGAEPSFLVETPRPLPASGPVLMLHVANLTEVKDQETLLRTFAAIRLVRDVRLRIAGEDHLGGRIQRRAEDLGIAAHVDFAGFVPHRRMPGQYASAHLLLQTSLHEAGGVAVCEAAAARVVVCGTATGILADLAPAGALAVPPGGHELLARTVLDLLEDPQRFLAIQEHAYGWAREHSVATAARLMAETYERLLAP